jgi:hypothetical protein
MGWQTKSQLPSASEMGEFEIAPVEANSTRTLVASHAKSEVSKKGNDEILPSTISLTLTRIDHLAQAFQRADLIPRNLASHHSAVPRGQQSLFHPNRFHPNQIQCHQFEDTRARHHGPHLQTDQRLRVNAGRPRRAFFANETTLSRNLTKMSE